VKKDRFRRLEINGGIVRPGPPLYLELPATIGGYADAQIDDYAVGALRSGERKIRFQGSWWPGTSMSVKARFSHASAHLLGTAGFGFWNAPWGDPTVGALALPRATWFFFASSPSDLPFAHERKGRGWFAATIDATMRQALLLAPLAPAVVLMNQIGRLRRAIWPGIRHRLGISHRLLDVEMSEWHQYELNWLPGDCSFAVDGVTILQTSHSPRGPLGFVCWLDNQYLVATNRGRFRWGVIPTKEKQWIEVADLTIRRIDSQRNPDEVGK
jgi:hypothetical protein